MSMRRADNCAPLKSNIEGGKFMKTTASDILVDAIHDWGVDVVFGLPGDGINGIMEALRNAPGQDPLHSGAARRSRRVHGVRAMRNTPENSASAWPPPVPAAFIC